MTDWWSDGVDEILDGDLAVAMAHVTPAKGVVITPVTNFALRDRGEGTVTLLSSLGAWRKLHRLRQDPRVALAFHTRDHGDCVRPEYVLIQGTASFSTTPDPAWLASIEPNWRRFMGERAVGPLWDRWLRVYHWERVAIVVAVERVTIWPDLACAGVPTVEGTPRSATPPTSQRAPAKGTGSRLPSDRVATDASRLPHRLLGWVDIDGFPVVVPVGIGGSSGDGVRLIMPSGAPDGERRAGLTAHWFSAGVLGQTQQVLTGWLSSAGGHATYAPHTRRSYRLPPSRLLYRLVVGAFARRGLRQARRVGFLTID